MFNAYGSQASQRMVVKVKNVIARSLPIFCMEEYCPLSTEVLQVCGCNLINFYKPQIT